MQVSNWSFLYYFQPAFWWWLLHFPMWLLLYKSPCKLSRDEANSLCHRFRNIIYLYIEFNKMPCCFRRVLFRNFLIKTKKHFCNMNISYVWSKTSINEFHAHLILISWWAVDNRTGSKTSIKLRILKEFNINEFWNTLENRNIWKMVWIKWFWIHVCTSLM